MRKLKNLLISVSAASLVLTAAPVMAEESETQAVTEAISEVEEAAAAVSQEAAQATVSSDDDISASDQASLQTYVEQYIEMITSLSDAQMEEVLHPSSILTSSDASTQAAVQSWLDNREDLGAFSSFKEHEISVSDDTITIESTCEFANKEGLVTIVLNRDDFSMDSMTFSDNEKSLGKSMEEAALNTVMGLGVVFLVLFFLTFLIGQFKRISQLEQSWNKKNAPAPAAAPAAPAPAPVAAAPVQTAAPAAMDNGELIAVISAAIAAAEGTSTDGFVVRTIRKSKRSR